jgi:RNA polymerase sigma-70 factor, ECF subfamily
MSAVVRGDRSALEALYNLHAPVLLALAVRMLRDRGAAEDLVHDVFLEAWHHARDFDPARGSVRTWLLMRARSRALDRQRRHMRSAQRLERFGATQEDSRSMEDRGDDGSVRRALALLPEHLQGVIDLAYFEGLSASEISGRTGVPVGTVKSRLARALGVLRAQLWMGGLGTAPQGVASPFALDAA